jgi:hypothetical protein
MNGIIQGNCEIYEKRLLLKQLRGITVKTGLQTREMLHKLDSRERY